MMRARNYAVPGKLLLVLLAACGSAWAAKPAATLDDPAPQAGAAFGQAVAMLGDSSKGGKGALLVGAPAQTVNGNTGQGRAYVFSGSSHHLLFTLDDPTPQADAGFGSGVAATTDRDGDGVPDLLVSAPGQVITRPGVLGRVTGQVFVFSGADGHLIESLSNPGTAGMIHFNSFAGPVATLGDVNGDGVADLLVSTVTGRLGFGLSVVFHVEVLSGTDGSVLSDLSGYGFATATGGTAPHILAGARRFFPFNNPGSAAVFDGATGLPLLTLASPAPQNGDNFGSAVASVGDIDGDGIADYLVGAPRESVNGTGGQGQAYVFSGASGRLLFTLDDPAAQAEANFGSAVQGIADVDGDGVPDLVVGAPGQAVAGHGAQGEVFIFSGATGKRLLTVDTARPEANAQFGAALSAADSRHGNGKPDLLAGAPGATVNDNSAQGQALVFALGRNNMP